ncbi:hypothetical protein H634G_03084 [Metarhizium anisopliae BRIP 53293]|uniref:GPI anchored protein n=1 Tax=Metarhizium anisopliae BRIP 53293 TaxID=1291518 RepID=A0A0D9P6V1_METAN|nr:hypothetical protein H634G_03084 [Metarhizium anisopliae BRIP 53293]
MLASAVILSLAGLVAADKVPFESMISPIGDLKALSPRASAACDTGTACGDSCIDIGAQCCSQSEGTFCRVGYGCQRDGCCPLGHTCYGPPSNTCEGDRVKCGKSCAPGGSQCCSQSNGIFCIAGTSCVGTTQCSGPQRPASGSGSSSGSGSGTMTSGSVTATSDISGGVTPTQGSSATSTYSLRVAPSIKTSDSGSGSASGSSSATASASGSGSGSGSSSGDSTPTASSASPTDDKKNPSPSPTGAGAINSPSILLGLLAAVLLL